MAASGGRLGACWSAVSGSVRFYPCDQPSMSGRESVRYLHRFRLGDTYQLKTRSWLLPQFLSGALTLCGVILTLVGIISLQINKYLHVCDSNDRGNCDSNKANINNVMMPIGVGSTGGGLSLILISGFIFVHAFCVIYDDTEHQDDAQQTVPHIPAPTLLRDAFGGSIVELPPPPPTATTTPPPLEVPPQETPPPHWTPSPPSTPPPQLPLEKSQPMKQRGDAAELGRSQSFYDNLSDLAYR